jgi:tetratricopeptide (TPR) repeat protein
MEAAHSPPTIERPIARFVQRNERRLIAAWLAGCVLVLALLAYAIAFGGAERAIEAWDGRWTARIDQAQSLVRARGASKAQLTEAAAELEALDRDFPAQFIKHRLDRERERILGLLGECYVALDKHTRSIETLQRLVAFDPKNYDNHFRLAEAQRHFAKHDEARAAYLDVLAIHPTHLPTLEALIGMGDAGSLYAQVVDDYEHYLDAWLLARIRVSFGEHAVDLDIPVDGREHKLEGLVDVPDAWSGTICIETRGYSARLGRLELTPPLRVGVVEPLQVVHVDSTSSWNTSGGNLADQVELLASGPDSRMCVDGASAPRGVARLQLKLTLFKALPADVWQMAGKAYKNRLEAAKLREAERRSRVGGCLQAGSVFED